MDMPLHVLAYVRNVRAFYPRLPHPDDACLEWKDPWALLGLDLRV